MSYRLKYAEKEVRYKLERAKYYDEGMTRIELVEFLSDLLDNLDADDIHNNIIAEFEDNAHDDCFPLEEHEVERDKLEDRIFELEETIKELERETVTV